ncbi:hypothetical protein [Bacillus massilioanorexius]|uniref:hypothetical protein n=1 Tax=Bacillus TaxID=1386 RepID=UPI0004759EC7
MKTLNPEKTKKRSVQNDKVSIRSTHNLTLGGYAPFNEPEIAFSVVVPNTKTDSHPVNKKKVKGFLKHILI